MIAGIPIELLTPSGVILLGIVFIMNGWLVPKRFYDRLEKTCDLKDEALALEREARKASEGQVIQLLEQSKTTQHMVEGIFEIAKELRTARQADV